MKGRNVNKVLMLGNTSQRESINSNGLEQVDVMMHMLLQAQNKA